MNIYRLYVLDDDDRIEDAFEKGFADDATALAQAEAVLREEYAVEVWTGGRLVGRLGGEFHVEGPI